jgi:hypothetical protein
MSVWTRPGPGGEAVPGRDIVVLALRRSGTTALWRLLRQDPRHVCYDEPFSPLLRRLPANNAKRTWNEFIALRAHDPASWAARFAPVDRAGEFCEAMTPAQADYLAFLSKRGPVVIYETRAFGKLEGICAVLDRPVVIHLHRHPVAFASSHMIASQNPGFMRGHLHRLGFFRRWFRYDSWGMEAHWRPPLRARTEAWLRAEAVVPPAPRAPAIHKLLAIWLASYRQLERDGRHHAGERFLSLSFEAFCRSPAPWLEAIYRLAGRVPHGVDCSALHPASPGYRPGDPRWQAAARAVGFTPDELARFFAPGAPPATVPPGQAATAFPSSQNERTAS